VNHFDGSESSLFTFMTFITAGPVDRLLHIINSQNAVTHRDIAFQSNLPKSADTFGRILIKMRRSTTHDSSEGNNPIKTTA
jgi:hypothetical protein